MAKELKVQIVNGPGKYDLLIHGLAEGEVVKFDVFVKRPTGPRAWVHNEKKDPTFRLGLRVESATVKNREAGVWCFTGKMFCYEPYNGPLWWDGWVETRGFVSLKNRRGHAGISVPDGALFPSPTA